MKLRIIQKRETRFHVERKVLGLWFQIYKATTFVTAKTHLLEYVSDKPPEEVMYEYDSKTKKETYY